MDSPTEGQPAEYYPPMNGDGTDWALPWIRVSPGNKHLPARILRGVTGGADLRVDVAIGHHETEPLFVVLQAVPFAPDLAGHYWQFPAWWAKTGPH